MAKQTPKKPSGKKQYDVIRPKSKRAATARPTVKAAASKAKTSPKKPAPSKQPADNLPRQSNLLAMYRRLFASIAFGRLYALLAVTVLAFTTVIWSVLGAQLHMANADQLADPLLFQQASSFHHAIFPAAHTMLFKWPLFWLVAKAHFSTFAFVSVTVLSVLLTVAVLAYVLYRIDRRPAVFGTLCLALASVLLLVPSVPYAGALLPVNMAMLTTRNLEYAVYLLCLVFVVRAPHLRDWRFWLAVLGLAVLGASDHLFLIMSIAGAALGLLLYSLRRVRSLTDTIAAWLFAGLLAAAGSLILIGIVHSVAHTTVSGGSAASPYAISTGTHGVLLGSVYGVLGFLTNFGANPAYDATILRNLPHQFGIHFSGATGLGYIVNLLVCVSGVLVAALVAFRSLHPGKTDPRTPDNAALLSLTLILSTLVALGSFIFTNHYYPVDARYLSIGVFAIFVALADYARQHQLPRNYVVIGGGVILLGIFLAIPSTINTYANDKQALADITGRNTVVTQVMAQRHVSALVGDYWRVLPIQQAANRQLQIVALQNCEQMRSNLITTANLPNIHKQAFAYLLSLDKSLTDFPSCSLAQITKMYGRPDANILVAGTFTHPLEELLFYDRGAHPTPDDGGQGQQTLTSLRPISPNKLPSTVCDGPTLMNIVAHQDDDLLFTSPDLITAIRAGDCVRSVYVTAGDAGADKYYWLGRQQGSEAAYSSMIGHNEGWQQQVVKLGDQQYATVASPRGDPAISLIFLDLPDGNLQGTGFSASNDESLQKLKTGAIHTITSVDGQSNYTSDSLTTALVTLMQTFVPTDIHTQATLNLSNNFPDHSDHLATGHYAQQAYAQYLTTLDSNTIPPSIHYYVGYPVRDQPANVSGDDLATKEAAFFAYGHYDRDVCHGVTECQQTPTYGSYLTREYQQP